MSTAATPNADELARMVAVLGPVARLTYAPSNIYPMSAPRFTKDIAQRRPELDGAPLGIYVHIPFCNYHCNFCFYATKIGASSDQMQRYVDALRRELQSVPQDTPLTQLFIGGGTPTVLPAELLDQVLEGVFSRTTDAGGQVHTVECSPESLTEEHLAVLTRRGIERVSMGVQSLNLGVLQAVDRDHSAVKALEACRQIVDSGRMLNVDLIYGLPGQTPADFVRDFAELVDAGVHSVTAYNLRVNERTPVAGRLEEDERLDIRTLVQWRACVRQVAADHGFEPVRWHTFRRRDASGGPAALRHEDRTGWGNQFGAGMSARSRLNGVVYRNYSAFDAYLARLESGESTVEQILVLDAHEQRLRFVAMTLGDGQALSHEAYSRQFESELSNDFSVTLDRLIEAELVADEGTHVRMTDHGQLVYDLVMRAFYPDAIRHWLDSRQELIDRRFSTSSPRRRDRQN